MAKKQRNNQKNKDNQKNKKFPWYGSLAIVITALIVFLILGLTILSKISVTRKAKVTGNEDEVTVEIRNFSNHDEVMEFLFKKLDKYKENGKINKLFEEIKNLSYQIAQIRELLKEKKDENQKLQAQLKNLERQLSYKTDKLIQELKDKKEQKVKEEVKKEEPLKVIIYNKTSRNAEISGLFRYPRLKINAHEKIVVYLSPGDYIIEVTIGRRKVQTKLTVSKNEIFYLGEACYGYIEIDD